MPTVPSAPSAGAPPGARSWRVSGILASLDNLPTLPAVVMRVMELANDANAKATDFEEVIQKDPSLARKVLRLVNSPFFGLRHEVTSVAHAVVLLGFKTVRSIVIAAKTSKLLNRQLTQYGFEAGGMWKHSMSCATLCHFVAKRARLDKDTQEQLFVAGLLHDVGKIVIAPQLSELQDEFDAARRRDGGSVVAAESELVGMSHDDVGGRMAAQWKLDEGLQFLIRSHHRTEVSPEAKALHVLQIADDLCHQLGIGRRIGPRAPSPHYADWLAAAELGAAAELTASLREPLEQLQAVFESLVRD